MPLFDHQEIGEFFVNRKPLGIAAVKERLIRKYQGFKSAYYLEGKRDSESLYDRLFSVDYQVEGSKAMYVSDMSFTFLHWRAIEQLE